MASALGESDAQRRPRSCVKATMPSIAAPQAGEKSWASLLCELTKARLTSLALFTTFIGFYLGSGAGLDFVLMFHALFGTALVAGGAAALNQYLEREEDAKMPRTENRPLPSRRMQPEMALAFGSGCASVGLIYLALLVNMMTSLLGAVTLVMYLFLYTPLKRVTSLNTVIGAIPGALPPLMGWTAARGEITLEGWSLFVILFFWQLPHFLAIAWIYREEYRKAGFAMLPVFDATGERTGRQAVCYTLALLNVSLAPFLFNVAGVVYLAGGLLLGLSFIACALRFSRRLTETSARQLFLMSIIYLPLVLALMVIDKRP